MTTTKKTTTKAAATKTTAKKAATKKATPKKASPKKASPIKAKADQRTGDAPRSQLDRDETKKPGTRLRVAARANKPKSKPAANGQAKTKKLSAINAAAKVLAESKTAMTTKEMIDAMAEQELWTSPGGKTPAQTLYSAILREIATKGNEARFAKTERGKFAANG